VSAEQLLFGSSLLATLIGAGVGFGLVIAGDRWKKKSERNDAIKLMINSLVKELEENRDGLKKFRMPMWNNENGKFQGEFGLLSVFAFQSVVSGGNFVSLPSKLQKPVREIYQNSELYNIFMNDIIHFSSFHLTLNQASVEANELIRRLQERVNELRPSIDDIITGLKTV